MKEMMQSIDIVAFALLLIGGLNWGLYGFFELDLVASIVGSLTIFGKIVYAAVGLAAVYEIAQFRVIQKRWTHAEAH